MSRDPRGVLSSAQMQMAVTFLVLCSNLFSLLVLWDEFRCRTDGIRDRDPLYTNILPRISTLIFVLAAGYFLYLAWVLRDRKEQGVSWLLLANGLVFLAGLIKADRLLLHPNTQTTVLLSEEA